MVLGCEKEPSMMLLQTKFKIASVYSVLSIDPGTPWLKNNTMVDHVLYLNFFWSHGRFQRLLGLGIAVRHEHEGARLGLECAALSVLRKGAGRTG